MNVSKLLCLYFISCLVVGCTGTVNKFSDDVFVTIADYQDHRQTDSLMRYLLHREPAYRIAAALAFGSVQDSAASMQLGTMLLEDQMVEARRAAAFALGQTPGTASVNALIPALQDTKSSVLREVLEGLGKTIQANDLQNLVNYHPADSIAEEGLAWGFYQLGLRGMADAKIVSRQLQFLTPSYSTQTRLAAAHFFSRSEKLKIQQDENLLIAAAMADKSPLVRMAATNGLRKIDSVKSIPVVVSILKKDSDYRTRVSAVRSLATWSSDRAMEGIIQGLNDPNPHVGVAASEVIKPIAKFRDILYTIALNSKNPRIQSNLYKVILTISPDEKLVAQIKSMYKSSASDYQKSFLLVSLSADETSYEFIAGELLHSTSYVVKSTAAQSLVTMSQKPGFSESLKKKFAEIYQQAILTGDPGVIGIISAALTNPASGYNKIISDVTFLQEAKKKLTLPKDIEALQPLEEAIAFFDGREKSMAPKNKFNHPIDWKLVKTIRTDHRVKIETTQGVIILKLLVEEAPGSTANFVALINKKYFDGKYVHRVVPNFVMQTGCNRGNGYGSEDYSIRSEFSTTRYQEGSVGMASAGKDTEGTQWFITHSPTPHLNGRYSIFAQVVEGMEVVHLIQVGDQIKSVSILTSRN